MYQKYDYVVKCKHIEESNISLKQRLLESEIKITNLTTFNEQYQEKHQSLNLEFNNLLEKFTENDKLLIETMTLNTRLSKESSILKDHYDELNKTIEFSRLEI